MTTARFLRALGHIATPAIVVLASMGQPSAAGAAASQTEADTIMLGGKILTMDEAGTVVQALALRNGKILATGTDKAMKRLAGPSTAIIDLEGGTVLPGFIDGHVHPQITIRMKSYLDAHFSVMPSLAAMLEKLRERARATPPGEWVIVAGAAANTTYFPEKRLPTRNELDDAAPSHPVFYLNGPHTSVVNSAALEKLEIKRGEKMLKGAFIELDADGEPTGIIHEGSPIFPDFALPADLLKRYAMEDIPAYFLPLGYTTLADVMPLPNYGPVRELAATGEHAPIRYSIAVFADSGGKLLPRDLEALKLPATADPDWFRLAGIKIWLDGDIPVRTGYIFGHYAGDEGAHGIVTNTQQELNDLVLRVQSAGLGMFIHSTGDRANVMALDAYQNALERGAPKTLMRIEHFGDYMLGPDVLKRARQLDVKANLQPGWIYTLGNVIMNNLGPDVAKAQAFQFKSMIDAGIEPGFGTDMTGFQRGTEDPFMHIEALLTRKTLDGSVFVPEQAIPLDQALRIMTIWSARSLAEGDVKGSIEPGKFADMIVLSEDITKTEPEKISDIRVIETYVEGERVYRRE